MKGRAKDLHVNQGFKKWLRVCPLTTEVKGMEEGLHLIHRGERKGGGYVPSTEVKGKVEDTCPGQKGQRKARRLRNIPCPVDRFTGWVSGGELTRHAPWYT